MGSPRTKGFGLFFRCLEMRSPAACGSQPWSGSEAKDPQAVSSQSNRLSSWSLWASPAAPTYSTPSSSKAFNVLRRQCSEFVTFSTVRGAHGSPDETFGWASSLCEWSTSGDLLTSSGRDRLAERKREWAGWKMTLLPKELETNA